MSTHEKNGERITVRVTQTLKTLIDKAVHVGGYTNPSDFIRHAIRQRILFMGIMEEERRCSCGKVLTREEIMNSQGGHCKACWEEAMQAFRDEKREAIT